MPLVSKGTALASRALSLAAEMRRQGFDIALGHASNAQVVAAKLLRRPSVDMMDYEHHPANHLGFRLADFVFLPEAVPYASIRKFGLSRVRWVPYPGLKEEIALAGFSPDPHFRSTLGVSDDEIFAVVRPAAEGAMYHRHENSMCDDVLDRLVGFGVRVLLAPRTTSQGHRYASRRDLTVLMTPVSGLDLLAAADVVIGAGGSMTREAAVLGTPVYSIFEGKQPAVDRWLVEQGRLSVLERASDLPRPTRATRMSMGPGNEVLDRFMELLIPRAEGLVAERANR
jgi:hypothetical protein